MSGKRIKKTNAMRLLTQAKIDYEVFTYRWKEDDLDARHVGVEINRPDDVIYKTLLAQGDKTGPLVAIIPSHLSIDLKKLAHASGNKKVDMLPLKDLEKTTGYIRGGCSPIGMKHQLPSYIDQRVNELDQVIVSAGQRGLQVGLVPQDLIDFIHADMADITMAHL